VRDAFQKLPQSECKWPLLRNLAAHNSFVFIETAGGRGVRIKPGTFLTESCRIGGFPDS
jgi:hypothetical protein